MATSSPNSWEELSPYLDQALALSAEDRRKWLTALREENPGVAVRVASLLDEHEALRRERFLDAGPRLVAAPGGSGERVGAYRLISSIGEGGMSTVWLAERSDGRFEKQVAIKFLRFAMASRACEQRFMREGKILGRLAHPHLAELIDAGVTANGEPYLVLEYIEGRHIDDYCDHHQLDVEARVRLFLDVVDALAHAHSHLIIHRDIKPSNVLVRNDGQVKLLDFGIAKLLAADADSGQATMLTLNGGGALTPEFAAPEQMTGGTITTSTDVYGLGVLLYVLLTGEHPAGPGPHSPVELVKATADASAPRPSDTVALQGATERAQNRCTSPDKLRRQLRGDLDTIAGKALKKNPGERYATVTALADDLRHYLKHEPISARPDTVAYRAGRFVRRNRTAVALAAIALAAIIIGVSATLIQSHAIRRQRDIALRERDRAKHITDFTVGMFKVSDPSETVGSSVTAREILDKAAKDVNTTLSKDPRLQAQMMHVMGNVYQDLGLLGQAQSLLERAVRVSRAAAGPDDPETLSSMNDLGYVLTEQGHPADAEKLERAALETQLRVLGADHSDTLNTMSNLAAALSEQGHFDEAEKLQREVLTKRRETLGPEDRDTIAAMDNLAVMLGEAGKLAESEQLEGETIEVERRVYGPDHLGVLMSMANQGDTLYYLGRLGEARDMWRQALDIEVRVLGRDHPETARSMFDLGCVAAREGNRDEAFGYVNGAIDHLAPRTAPRIDDDPAFDSLRQDPRYKALVKHAKQRAGTAAKCPL